MRRALAALIVLLPVAAPAWAQQPPPAAAAPADASAPAAQHGAPATQSITRAQFVQHAAEVAGHRFDAMDTAHAGVLTRAQMKAWRKAHHAGHGHNGGRGGNGGNGPNGQNGADGQDG